MWRRVVCGLGLAVIGSIIGAWLGGRWYTWRSPSFAGDLDHLGSVFGGGLVGCVAGALIGSVVLGQAHVPGRVAVAASLGCVVAAGLFAIAVWQIGAFTDADGPSGLRPYVGIALAPVAAGMVWFIVRWTRSPDNGD
jgi:tellurite resistance protein TehA-like permease